MDRHDMFGGAARIGALFVGAIAVGAGLSYVVHHDSGSSSANAAAVGSAPAVASDARQPSAGDRQTPSDGLGPPGAGGAGPRGGIAGELHILGTVTATTDSTVTVKSSGGTATYTVAPTTEIVRDGQQATLADVQVGDPVFVHVYPSSSGELLVERLFAGALPSGGRGGFGPPRGSGSPPGSDSTAPTT